MVQKGKFANAIKSIANEGGLPQMSEANQERVLRIIMGYVKGASHNFFEQASMSKWFDDLCDMLNRDALVGLENFSREVQDFVNKSQPRMEWLRAVASFRSSQVNSECGEDGSTLLRCLFGGSCEDHAGTFCTPEDIVEDES